MTDAVTTGTGVARTGGPGLGVPAVVAHRGNSAVAPQNTLAAFEAAWRAGAASIEIDIQLSADGHVVVIHDDTVDATTDGQGVVAELGLDALRSLDAGSWFAAAYAGQRVPTFAEVLDLMARRPGIDLLLELKGPWTAEQVRPVTDAIRAAGLADRVIGQSFWPESVEALAEADPELRRGLLVFQVPADPAELVRLCTDLGVMTCNPYGPLLVEHPDLVERLHAAGLQVMVWTLNEPEHWAAATALGVDAVITDRPDRLAGWLAARA
ncbi:glycerophosphodiester phosphodiesterase [Cellulomonas hominis]|uniref:glycerophosphodiester phosphodiesterase n=1 Tax=Cellulomonas hominis TaxID=156981 RepID=UPI001B9CAC19|nr:glycerophosphodiester phosphodiesterase family protein [Cellulomonas hominis]VTR78112.1 Glycerophosphodiester phosphodiesterase, cytoplasmic [Cellulomonas hominis]